MNFKNISLLRKDQIGIITIERKDIYNAIDLETEMEIGSAVEMLEQESIGAMIITGAGEKAFSSGADIVPYIEMDLVKSIAYMKKLREVLWKIENCRKPVVAAINGFCLGGGFELALACHYRISSDHAVFGFPEINVGVFPGNGGSQRLARLIGKGKALWYVTTGEQLKADEAFMLGVIHKVVPHNQLMHACEHFLTDCILLKSPIALWAAITSINKGIEMDLDSACQLDVTLASLCMGTDDFKEGVRAFVEKRKPVFKGN
ncbi:MAG: enoyl-CoA hydratase/isomerase family protein [Desulfatirhabdiaceae bacterium]